jgi:hypothetical protein
LRVLKRGRNGGGEGEERWELPSMLLGRGRRRTPRLRNRIRIRFAGCQYYLREAEGGTYRVVVVVPEDPADVLSDSLVGC